MRKELPQRLLRELLKNAKRSDRELAKVLGVSQPTITRTRHKLELEGVIQDYTIVPDFKKLGFELMVIGLVKVRPAAITAESIAKAKEYAEKVPQTIFSSFGEGMGMNGVTITFFKNYTELQQGLTRLRADWKDFLDSIELFVIVLGEGEYKRFSLTYLKDVPP
jgi:DNA-binding Lrp family transcriptional regulator